MLAFFLEGVLTSIYLLSFHSLVWLEWPLTTITSFWFNLQILVSQEQTAAQWVLQNIIIWKISKDNILRKDKKHFCLPKLCCSRYQLLSFYYTSIQYGNLTEHEYPNAPPSDCHFAVKITLAQGSISFQPSSINHKLIVADIIHTGLLFIWLWKLYLVPIYTNVIEVWDNFIWKTIIFSLDATIFCQFATLYFYCT